MATATDGKNQSVFSQRSHFRSYELEVEEKSIFINPHALADISDFFANLCFNEGFKEQKEQKALITDETHNDILELSCIELLSCIHLNSSMTPKAISRIVSNNPAIGSLDDVWIGANGINGDEKFLWTDGSPFVYHNWLAGQPNLNFLCVSSLARSSGRWSTDFCETKNFFVCKYVMTPTMTPTDCSDYYFNNGNKTDEIYRISPPGIGPFDVWCDMTTDGGGWTVFQKFDIFALSI